MNPQADDTVDPLKRGLNRQSSPRPNGGPLNVPPRSNSLDDIDDSAFAFDDEKPKVVRPAPVPTTEPVRPPSPVILPAAPAPLQVAEPEPAPQPTPAAPPVAASAAPQPAPVQSPPAMSALPPVAPTPAPAPTPVPEPAAPVVTVPSPAPAPAPPSNPAPAPPPPAPATPAPTPAPAIPPIPVQPVEFEPEAKSVSFEPEPVAAAAPPVATSAGTAASYQPAGPHIDSDLIERIDETPQQNSKDIEALIEHNHRLHRLKSFASFLAFCAGVVIAAFLINQFVFQSYYVDGTSMTPTLQNDDRLIIDKVEHTMANLQNKPYIPQRGQIVVLDSSIVGLNGRQEQLIKRVIGLPGDTIIIKDGIVTIKNKQNPDGFDVTRALGLNLQPTFVESPQEWTIDEGHVFVMGDNRVENGSYDSRAFGPIEANKIVGRLWARILPFDKAQVF